MEWKRVKGLNEEMRARGKNEARQLHVICPKYHVSDDLLQKRQVIYKYMLASLSSPSSPPWLLNSQVINKQICTSNVYPSVFVTNVTAKLILIDPLRKYSVQPLCLCRCLHKQPLPNSDLAYFSNMCNFRETDVNTSLYLMSAPTCRRFPWP